MGRMLLSVVVICFIVHLALGQLAIPLEYGCRDQPQELKIHRHQMLRQQNRLFQHKTTRSQLSHNINFLKKHFFKSYQTQHTTRHHQLTTDFNDNDDSSHLRVETFKLQPSSYAFSLPMIISGIKYSMSIDSGSSDMFIKGENAAGKPKQRYHCGQQCIRSNDHYQLGYLDGRIYTYQTKLQVEIGEHKFNQSILVAYKVQHNFEENQGLVGLSFAELATNPNPTFLQTLKNEKIIDAYAFGVNLNFQSKQRSFITFGSYDNQFFQGDLQYFPLTSRLFYYIKSQGVSVGDSDMLIVKQAIFDTGNTCISIPDKYEGNILKQFNRGDENHKNVCFFSVQNHANMFSVLRCKVVDFNALPVLNIHLGGKTYPIEKQFYLQACDHRPSEMSTQTNSTNGIFYCDTYIESVKRMPDLFLGDGFFNRYYTYFNLDTKQVGIAKNKQIIKIEKIIENDLDADGEDWETILTTLNPNESREEIRKQINRAVEEQENKKKKEK